MARWDHGYVTDVAYTTNAYQETTPSWLAACSVLLGYRPTDLAAPFRYADLGCGNGLSALIVAATNPHAEVWGFDFNPTHIENARDMAARAKLTNVHFEDISFEALAHGTLAAAGRVRHHRRAWRAELDLAGKPPAPDVHRRPAATARRARRISATTSPPAGPAWSRSGC